ncbi:hypothetical protein JHK87_031506 [Glycine soja]|nr:hypothetical protein JHK87_031506 [Glycine soja]
MSEWLRRQTRNLLGYACAGSNPAVDERLQTQNTMNTSSSNASDVNVIEVPFAYHRQWSPNYPTYVLFDYEGNKHFIKLHKYGNRFFFGDELKELRRTHDIHESVVMRFVGWDKNITFSVDVVGPLHRQTHQRATTTIRHHVFTIDVCEDMIQHNYQLPKSPNEINTLPFHLFDELDLVSLDRKEINEGKWS